MGVAMTMRRVADVTGMALLAIGLPAVALLSMFALAYGWLTFETWMVCLVAVVLAATPLIYWVTQNVTPDLSDDPTFGWGGEIR